jgi:hypothetical protein
VRIRTNKYNVGAPTIVSCPFLPFSHFRSPPALNPTCKSTRHPAWPLPRAISAKQVSIWETAQAGNMATRSLSKCALAAKVDPFKTSASFNPSPTIHPSHNQTIPIFNSRCHQFQITPKLPNIPSNLKPHTQPSVWAPGPLTAPPPPLLPQLTNPAPMTIDVTLKHEPGSSRALWGDDKDRRR